MLIDNLKIRRYGPILLAAAPILLLYLTSLQTIPNGASHPYMIDVGEMQVALNVWGTLHTTGYPLYSILGNLFTPPLELAGINPAAAAGLFSMLWTALALTGFGILLKRITQNRWAALGVIPVLALTRSIWIHSIIAEVYSMSFAILVALWIIVFMMKSWPLERRVQALALVGGIGVAHHRALGFAAPGLLLALWPELYRERPRAVRANITSIPFFLGGFLPYIYLPLRAHTDAPWVYGDVGTWEGFWFLFRGSEADYLVTMPSTLSGWIDNLSGTVSILARELSAPGLIIAVLSLFAAAWKSPFRAAARILILTGLGFFIFAVSYHQAVLPEAILMMTLPVLVAGMALALSWAWMTNRLYGRLGFVLLLVWAAGLYFQQRSFIASLVDDQTGIHSIETAGFIASEENAVLMLPWGPRYFAVAYSRLVTGENASLELADHNADIARLSGEGKTFYTEPDTLYDFSANWWEEQIGPVFLTSAAPGLVRLNTSPDLRDFEELRPEKEVTDGIWLASSNLICGEASITLAIEWFAAQQPERDLSVFVHLTSADSPIPLRQADVSHPVYGWRPTSAWQEGELISDHYVLPKQAGGERVVFGMYVGLPDGSFQNFGETTLFVAQCNRGTLP